MARATTTRSTLSTRPATDSLLAHAYVQTSVLPVAGDTHAPSTPTGLAASNITQSALTLSWNPSTDNVQVTGYDLYRDGTKVASSILAGREPDGLSAERPTPSRCGPRRRR